MKTELRLWIRSPEETVTAPSACGSAASFASFGASPPPERTSVATATAVVTALATMGKASPSTSTTGTSRPYSLEAEQVTFSQSKLPLAIAATQNIILPKTDPERFG